MIQFDLLPTETVVHIFSFLPEDKLPYIFRLGERYENIINYFYKKEIMKIQKEKQRKKMSGNVWSCTSKRYIPLKSKRFL